MSSKFRVVQNCHGSSDDHISARLEPYRCGRRCQAARSATRSLVNKEDIDWIPLDIMEDPMPNELDNALSQLIPAVKACSNPNNPKLYRDLTTFEQMAGTAPSWRALARASTGPGACKYTTILRSHADSIMAGSLSSRCSLLIRCQGDGVPSSIWGVPGTARVSCRGDDYTLLSYPRSPNSVSHTASLRMHPTIFSSPLQQHLRHTVREDLIAPHLSLTTPVFEAFRVDGRVEHTR